MSKDTNFHNTVIAYLRRIVTDMSSSSSSGSTESTSLDILQELENIETTLTGSTRSINVVESLVDGVTDANVQSVSILFLGDNGTIDGTTATSGMIFKFCPNKGEDTVDSVSYTVPNTDESKVIISYVR